MQSSKVRDFVVRFQSILALTLVFFALTVTSAVEINTSPPAGTPAISVSVSGLVDFWHSFFTPDNALKVLLQISINLCLSIGMTLVILSGGIDLSVGSILALSGAIAAGLLKGGISLGVFGVILEPTALRRNCGRGVSRIGIGVFQRPGNHAISLATVRGDLGNAERRRADSRSFTRTVIRLPIWEVTSASLAPVAGSAYQCPFGFRPRWS